MPPRLIFQTCHAAAVRDANTADQRHPVKPIIGARGKDALHDFGPAAGDCEAACKLGLQPLVRCVRMRIRRGRIESCIDCNICPCSGTPTHGVPCGMPVGKGLGATCLGCEDQLTAW